MLKRACLLYFIFIPWILSCQTQASQTQRKDDENVDKEASVSRSLLNFTKSAEISLDYQKAWYEMLQKEKCDESWGLFSQGGFTNRGQTVIIRIDQDFMIYVENEDKKQTDFSLKQKLPSTQVNIQLLTKISSKDYQDFNPKAFDALKREYVHINCSSLNREDFAPRRTKITHTAKPKMPEELSELITTIEKLRNIKE